MRALPLDSTSSTFMRATREVRTLSAALRSATSRGWPSLKSATRNRYSTGDLMMYWIAVCISTMLVSPVNHCTSSAAASGSSRSSSWWPKPTDMVRTSVVRTRRMVSSGYGRMKCMPAGRMLRTRPNRSRTPCSFCCTTQTPVTAIWTMRATNSSGSRYQPRKRSPNRLPPLPADGVVAGVMAPLLPAVRSGAAGCPRRHPPAPAWGRRRASVSAAP